MDIDNIENWDPPEVLKKYWAGGISGEAKDGSVVWIDLPCHLDYKGTCMCKFTTRALPLSRGSSQ